MKRINFLQNTSKNYAEVQGQLFDTIERHLRPDEYSCSYATPVEGCLNFAFFLRLAADVVMSHGVADKTYFWIKDENGERYANRLAAVFVPGHWLRNRILKSKHLRLEDRQVFALGWPRLDVLREKQKVFDLNKPASCTLNVLWAPTHDKARRGPDEISTSSFPLFEQHIKPLSREFLVHTSLHPRNRDDKMPTVDKLLAADVVISDFGTMVYEAWALGKPVIFPRWILKDSIETYLKSSAEAHIMRNRIGYHPDSFEEMLAMLRSGPVVGAEVDSFMTEYLVNYRGGMAGLNVANALRQLADG